MLNVTPKSLRYLLLLTIALSFLSSFFPSWNPLFPLLSLSLQGVLHGFFWQLFTYTFLEVNFFQTNLSYLFHLFFYCVLFWTFGTTLLHRISEKEFLIFYFSTGIISGLITLLFMYLTGVYSILTGMSSILYGIIILWIFFYPHTNFTVIYKNYPLKWILLIVMAFNLYLDGSSGNWIKLVHNLSAVVWAYLFLKIRYRQTSPFEFLRKIERRFFKSDF